MKTSKRIWYYCIGLGIGILLVVVLFAGKDLFGFLPGNRVRKDIQNSTLMVTAQQKAMLECASIGEDEIFKIIEEADVNFSNSVTAFVKETFVINSSPVQLSVKKYELEYDKTKLSFWICPDSNISIIYSLKNVSTCEIAEGLNKNHLEILYMPEALVFSKLKAKELYLDKSIKCQMACNEITKEDIEGLFEDGDIMFEHSYADRNRANPIYFIRKTLNGTEWVFWVELGENKTRVKYIVDISGVTIAPNEFLINTLVDKAKVEDACDCF